MVTWAARAWQCGTTFALRNCLGPSQPTAAHQERPLERPAQGLPALCEWVGEASAASCARAGNRALVHAARMKWSGAARMLEAGKRCPPGRKTDSVSLRLAQEWVMRQ